VVNLVHASLVPFYSDISCYKGLFLGKADDVSRTGQGEVIVPPSFGRGLAKTADSRYWRFVYIDPLTNEVDQSSTKSAASDVRDFLRFQTSFSVGTYFC
jgi:hypothetical protein